MNDYPHTKIHKIKNKFYASEYWVCNCKERHISSRDPIERNFCPYCHTWQYNQPSPELNHFCSLWGWFDKHNIFYSGSQNKDADRQLSDYEKDKYWTPEVWNNYIQCGHNWSWEFYCKMLEEKRI